MKKVLYCIIAIACLCGSNAMAQTAVKKKVAVYMTGNDVQDSYKKVIGARLVSAITSTNEYAAVERTADFLAALSSEQDFQTSGEVQDSQIARLGQKFGVRYVVVADVSEVFDELFVAARLINVESALVEKAFDTNASAESMAQLIDISSKVANGLLGTGGFAQSGEISTEPTNMSLCAVKDGKVVYITPTQWEQMKESEKITFNKKGVCMIENGEAFVVAMRDTGYLCSSISVRSQHPPTTEQLMMMLQNIDNLNIALKCFGGEALKTKNSKGDYIYYWTSDVYDSRNYVICAYSHKEDLGFDDPVPWIFNRPVYKLNEIY
ncbi:MAG: hypothetical protein J1F40_02015 [Prevotellaceae bacterium]|nr:hypothetical protein [Prevotellaceae bacterium]